MLLSAKNINLFANYIQKGYLEIPYRVYLNNEKTGTLQINLLTEKSIFSPLSTYTQDDKGFFVFGNYNVSTSVLICNDLPYFVKAFKNQLDLEYTTIIFTHKNLLAINYEQLRTLLSLNKDLYTYYQNTFDRFLLDAFLCKGLTLDTLGNYIYDEKIITPSLTKTEINKLTNLRTIIKHIS